MTKTIYDYLPEKGKKIVFLTGAGVSTESGIPDFRSKTGIYQDNNEKMLTWQYFHEKPLKFYEFFFNKLYFPDKNPNIIHEEIKKLENDYEVLVVTQNVDGFHSEVGNKNIIEFHGNSQYVVCTKKCSFREPLENWKLQLSGLSIAINPYTCPNCKRGKIKPDVVLFGEVGTHFNNKTVDFIRKEMLSSGAIFVLGTSLKVYPFASFTDFKHEQTNGIIVAKNPPIRDGYISLDMELINFFNK
jgi:NAD-dependent deacetylase